jgi:hypothetical protein
MNRAPFHRTLGEAAGGHTVFGGATNRVSPWNGNIELNLTADPSPLRAVASSHSSISPSDNIAPVTAEYSESP